MVFVLQGSTKVFDVQSEIVVRIILTAHLVRLKFRELADLLL